MKSLITTLALVFCFSTFADRKEILERAKKATVMIERFDKNGRVLTLGTGVFISKNKILTNFHVAALVNEGDSLNRDNLWNNDNTISVRNFKAKAASSIKAKCGEGRKPDTGELWSDVNVDLCILEVDGPILEGIRPLKMSFKKASKGYDAYTYGVCSGIFKLNDQVIGEFRKEMRDHYSAPEYTSKLKLSIYELQYGKNGAMGTCGGDSGSPVLDRKGKMIGLIKGSLSKSRNSVVLSNSLINKFIEISSKLDAVDLRDRIYKADLVKVDKKLKVGEKSSKNRLKKPKIKKKAKPSLMLDMFN